MQLVDGSVTLVIAGAWNAAILTPPWMAKYALALDGNVAVTINAPFTPAGLNPGAAMYELPGLKFFLNQGSLVLSPTESGGDALDAVQAAAKRILTALAHTPVAALGFNVGFQADDTDASLGVFRAAQGEVVDAVPAGWTASGNIVRTSLSNDESESILHVDKAYDGTAVRLQFNFHVPITTSEDAIAVLDRVHFRQAFQQASEMAKQIFKEELNNDADN